MQRTLLTALLVTMLVTTGCFGGAPGTPTDAPLDTPATNERPTDARSTSTMPDAPTTSRNSTDVRSTPRSMATVEYVFRAEGPALSKFRSLNVTIRTVAFQHGTRHQCHGRLVGPNATLTPTLTPQLDPDVDCVVFRLNRTVDLTEHRDASSIGRFTVPERLTGDTYLVVTARNGTLASGERVVFDPDDPGFVAFASTVEREDGVIRRLVTFNVPRVGDDYGVNDGAGRRSPVAGDVPAVEPRTSWSLAVEGEPVRDAAVTLRVTRDGEPVRVTLVIDGDTDRERFETGPDGTVRVEIGNPGVFEVFVQARSSRS